MERSIRWFVDRPAVANLLALILILGGLLAIPQTRQETLPNVPLERIGIVATLTGAAPGVVEQRLCTPLETSIYSLEGLSDVRSESREGSCSITVDVVEGYQPQDVRDRIAARVDTLNSLPPDASRPQVEEVVFRNRVARLLLAGNASPRDLHRLAWSMRDRLLKQPAITEVELEGLPKREMSIDVSRQNLYRYQLSFSELSDAIQTQAGRVTGGLLRTPESNALIQSGAQLADADGYRRIPVRESAGGETLLLDQVAVVTDGFERNAMAAWLNGQPAVALDVYRTGDQSVVAIADSVHAFIDAEQLPDGMQLVLWDDGSRQYQDRSGLLRDNALQGLLLLVIVLGVFFGLRLSLWVGLGIPVAMLGACIVLPLVGESFNTISLFAFILVLGIVVDDAVIVGESCEQQVRRDGATTDAVFEGVRRVAGPITVAVLTTMIAFLPMLFLPGPEGEFMRVVPLIAIVILAFSLMESLWILPAHLRHAVMLKPTRSERFSAGVNRRFDNVVNTRLLPVLGVVMDLRYTMLTIFAGLFMVSLALIHSGWLTVSMFSSVEGDKVMADVTFPEGTSAKRVLSVVSSLQASAESLASGIAAEVDEPVIRDVYAEQGHSNNYSTAHDAGRHLRARVTLALNALPGHPGAAQIAARWREAQGDISGAASVQFHSSLNQVKPDIHINLYHDDLAQLDDISQQLQRTLNDVDGVYEVANSMASEFSEIDIQIRPGARLGGMNEAQLGQQVNAAFHGTEVDRLPQGDHDVPVMLRLPAGQSDSLWHLEKLPITLTDGSVAPLDALAALERRVTPAVINHYDRRRNATLTAYVDQSITSSGQVMGYLAQDFLAELPDNWPGASWAQAGKPMAIAEFVRYLSVAYVVALLAMFFVLTMMFGNYWQPMLILLAIPFGMVGALLGHALLGIGLTLWSIVGIVAVSGVVVNDNLVLISRINELSSQVKTPREAIMAALRERFRPIMLTTLTTFVAVAPLAFETSIEARFLVPMAISLGFGVLFASVITLLMVPSMYLVVGDVAVFVQHQRALWRGNSELDSVEQAYRAGAQSTSVRRSARNPYSDEVLRASWEAGLLDSHGER